MLIVPPFQFAHCTDNLTGTPSTSGGTNFSAGANNADAAAVSVLSALAHDAHFLALTLAGLSTAAADGQCLVDILIDRAGGTSWASLIDDLCAGFTFTVGNTVSPAQFYFPLWIPAGASIGVQARTAHTANITTGRIIAFAYGEPSRPGQWWCGQKVESLGINAASSKGTDVVPGNTGTYGSWTSVGSPTSGRYGAIQLGINGSDSDAAQLAYHWQIGYGSQKLPGSPNLWSLLSTSESGMRVNMPIWCDIAEGAQMQVRGTASGTAETINVGLYGVH